MNRQSISTEKVLAESVITLTLSKLVASASIIIMFILLSYILSTNEYGSFRQVWLINKSFMEIFAFGIPTSIFYFIPRLADSHKKIFVIQSFLLLSFFGILFSCLIFFFAGNISILFNNPELTHMLQLFCLYPLFVLPTLAVQSILVSIKKANQLDDLLPNETIC